MSRVVCSICGNKRNSYATRSIANGLYSKDGKELRMYAIICNSCAPRFIIEWDEQVTGEKATYKE